MVYVDVQDSSAAAEHLDSPPGGADVPQSGGAHPLPQRPLCGPQGACGLQLHSGFRRCQEHCRCPTSPGKGLCPSYRGVMTGHGV